MAKIDLHLPSEAYAGTQDKRTVLPVEQAILANRSFSEGNTTYSRTLPQGLGVGADHVRVHHVKDTSGADVEYYSYFTNWSKS